MVENLFAHFREIVIEDAKKALGEKIDEQREKINKLVLEYAENALREEEIQLKNELTGIEQKYAKMAAEAETGLKRELAKKRAEMKNEIYNMLLEKLYEFTETKEYEDYLKNKANDAVKIAGGNKIIAEARDADKGFIEEIVDEVRAAEGIIGGARFIIPKKEIIIDNTLKTAAEEVMELFHEIKIFED